MATRPNSASSLPSGEAFIQLDRRMFTAVDTVVAALRDALPSEAGHLVLDVLMDPVRIEIVELIRRPIAGQVHDDTP